MDKNEEKAYEDGFVAGMQHDAESRVSKFIDASMQKWVGLTEDEVDAAWGWAQENFPNHKGFTVEEVFALEIELKLKDKNNG